MTHRDMVKPPLLCILGLLTLVGYKPIKPDVDVWVYGFLNVYQ